MKLSTKILISLFLVTVIGVSFASYNPRAHEITNYKPGHTHDAGGTQGALSHSGGTDAAGCHNGSVPYHCH